MSETVARYEGREPVTRRVHVRSWVADLESPAHGEDRQLVVDEAVDAVAQTAAGTRVDVVTHKRHGHPEAYLYPRLEERFDGLVLSDDGRCRCGGYVTRIEV